MNLSIKGSNYIGYTPSKNAQITFHTFSCREQKENDEIYCQITEDELDSIFEKATKAAEEYALIPIRRRQKFLKSIIDLLEENREILVQQFCKESSLLAERANIELTRTQTQIQTYLDFISKEDWNLSVKQCIHGVAYENRLFPLGVIVVFGASNFPFAYSTIGGDTASALAAGNPVIYKANPYHAGTSELVTQVVLEAAKLNNMPDGVFSLVQGNDYWIGEKLVKNESVKAVGFTGSVKGGKALLEYAKQRYEPIPVFCEMGSLNPTFIFKDVLKAKSDEIVEKLSHAILNDAGQFCTKPGLIFIEDNDAKDFIHLMEQKIENATSIPMLHPLIYHAFEKLCLPFEKYRVIKSKKETKEFYAKPELVVMNYEEFMSSHEAKEEVFGPFSIIVKCQNQEEMKAAMRSIGGHLTASYWSNEELSEDWIYLLTKSVGRVIRNGVPTGVVVIDAQHHGGNFPSTSDSRFTAVGKNAIYRFLQPVMFQFH